jgi:hypothetical protein
MILEVYYSKNTTMKKLMVLFIVTLLTISCQKIQTPFTTWENKRDENVVIVCNNTDFVMLPMTKYTRDEMNTTKTMWGKSYQVYRQRDYLKEDPIQTGTAKSYNVIDY